MSVSAPLTLASVFAGVPHEGVLPDLAVHGVALDSRFVVRGDVFLAVPGRRVDGRAFVHDAVAAGAAAVVVPADEVPEPSCPVPVLRVPGLAQHVSRLAANAFGDPSRHLRVVGVTGTNGKTSVAHLICQGATLLGRRAAFAGTLGWGRPGSLEPSDLTTQDAVTVQRRIAEQRADGVEVLAMEASSHALDQGRVRAVAFDVAIFTNLSRDHLDYHGTMARYGEAKRLLFLAETLETAVVDVDDAFGARLPERIPAAVRILRLSAREPGADLRIADVEPTPGGLRFRLETPWGTARPEIPLYGTFSARNVAAAVGALCALGHDFVTLTDRLGALEPVPGRLERLGGGAGEPLVFVDYAHSPDALAKALECVRAHARGRVLCVFGAGGDRDRGKRPLMGAAASRLADACVVTDDNPRTEDGDRIAAEVVAGCGQGADVRVIRDRSEAIAAAVAAAGPDDVVLVAGKGHETEQVVGTVRRPFSDLEAARVALAARPSGRSGRAPGAPGKDPVGPGRR